MRHVARLVEAGELVRLHRGSYAGGEAWRALSSEQQGVQRILAHYQLSVGRSSMLPTYSHTSAARLHRLRLWNVDDRIHLIQRYANTTQQRSPQVVRHCTSLEDTETITLHGVKATSLTRTIFDCARFLPYRQALIIADQGLRKGVMRDDLEALANRFKGHKGIGTARRIVSDASPLAESPGESLTRHILLRMAIPAPQEQLVVNTRLGRHRLDFGWRDRKLALEFDGKAKYFDFAPTSEVLFEERRREKALVEDGWQFIRIEWKDLFREAELQARILRAWHRTSPMQAERVRFVG